MAQGALKAFQRGVSCGSVILVPHLAEMLPLLARARESLDRGYASLVHVGALEPIPCEAVTVYTRLRRALQDAEGAIVDAARAAGLHPPEDAPRTLALLGACPPGMREMRLGKEAIALAEAYLDGLASRTKREDEALRKAYGQDKTFAARARQIVEAFAVHARAGTDEAAPMPPRNLVLLRLIYTLGGSLWTFADAEGLLASKIQVADPVALKALWQQATQFESVARELEEATAPPPPLLPGWGWGALIGGGVVVAGGLAAIGVHLNRRDRAPAAEGPEEPWPPEIPATAEEQHALPAHGG